MVFLSGSTRFVKLMACITVSARSSFFFDSLNIGSQWEFIGLLFKKASHRSMDTFLRLRYCALPGPHTSGILNLASYMIVSDLGHFITKYACRKFSTIFIFLFLSGCFSMSITFELSTHGRSSKCFLMDTNNPSLCSGGTPETSQFTTRFDVSSNWHTAKFRIPT